MKKGMSLTVLVITIIVMIILATTIVLYLNKTEIISKASEAVDKTTLENITDQANIKLAQVLSNRATRNNTTAQIEADIKKDLEKTFGKEVMKNVEVKIEGDSVYVDPTTSTSYADLDIQINQLTGDGTITTYVGDNASITIPGEVKIKGKTVKIKYVRLIGIDFDKLSEDMGDDDITLVHLLDDKYSIESLNNITTLKLEEGIEEVIIVGLKNLKTLDLPSSLKKITDLSLNIKLQELIIPEGVTTLGEGCFAYDESLKTITFPTTLTTVGAVPFLLTGWLYEQNDGPIYAGNVFVQYKGELTTDATLTLKDETIAIADAAFSSDRGNNLNDSNTIYKLILPDTLKYIGEYAFSELTVTAEYMLPESLISIGRRAFYQADFYSIAIPSSVEYIGAFAFADIGGIGISRQIYIQVDKRKIECDAFDTSWEFTKLDSFVEKHNVQYKAE